MPDEIKKNTFYSDWPTPDAVMTPQPTAEQDSLWEKIYELVSADDLEEEVKFVNLPLKFRNFLASEGVADQMGAVGKKFNLVPLQIQKLAKTIKQFFTKEVSLISLDTILSEDLKVSGETAKSIREALSEILAVPETPPTRATLPSAPGLATQPTPAAPLIQTQGAAHPPPPAVIPPQPIPPTPPPAPPTPPLPPEQKVTPVPFKVSKSPTWGENRFNNKGNP